MEGKNESELNQTDKKLTCNITYADALSKNKTSANALLNNNPSSTIQDIMNGTDHSQDIVSTDNLDGILSGDKNSVSNMSNDSFEDTENSQLNSDSSAIKDVSTDSKSNDYVTGESTASAATLDSAEKIQNVLETNESNSSADYSDSEDESEMTENQSDIDNLAPNAMKWKFRRGIPDLDLPETVTMLETLYGSKVFLVGTAHFSFESQEDVAKTIRATQPDIVMIELCKSRVNILSLDEETVLEEAKGLNFQKIKATLEQNGLLQGLLYFLLLSMSVHLTKQLGMAPGGEFRRAYSEARQVPGCVVHLGDRPIHMTLQRALAKLSVWQKVRIAWHMLRAKGPISQEEVERCKQKDLLEEMLAEMTGEFPELSQVFVKERDIYLTYSLQMAALPMAPIHPDGVPAPRCVVGVVGIGHVPGIKENWGKVNDEDIPPILRIPEPSLSSKVLKYCIRCSLYAAGLYSVYKLFPRALIPNKLKSLTFDSSSFRFMKK